MILWLSVASAVACATSDAVQLRLQALPGREPTDPRLTIRGQLAGPTSGLHYKWFAVSGNCDPQQSDTAMTTFTFADGSTKDRITLEVWRDGQRIAQSEMDVALDPKRALRAAAARPEVGIVVTQVPPYEPFGGTDTRAQISGRIVGERGEQDVLIVYARADMWYRQPLPDAQIPIRPDGTWTTWTHTGGSYAVLLVRRDAGFFGRLDVLPAVRGLVLARAIVEGARK